MKRGSIFVIAVVVAVALVGAVFLIKGSGPTGAVSAGANNGHKVNCRAQCQIIALNGLSFQKTTDKLVAEGCGPCPEIDCTQEMAGVCENTLFQVPEGLGGGTATGIFISASGPFCTPTKLAGCPNVICHQPDDTNQFVGLAVPPAGLAAHFEHGDKFPCISDGDCESDEECAQINAVGPVQDIKCCRKKTTTTTTTTTTTSTSITGTTTSTATSSTTSTSGTATTTSSTTSGTTSTTVTTATTISTTTTTGTGTTSTT